MGQPGNDNDYISDYDSDRIDALLGAVEMKISELTGGDVQGFVAACHTFRNEAVNAKDAALQAKQDAQGFAQSASGSSSLATTAAGQAQNSARDAQSWAVGGTSSRTGENTNNAQYWSQQANGAAGRASASEAAAANSASSANGSASSAANSASTASTKANEAASSAASAQGIDTLAHSWAIGGTGTRAGEDTNNAKYWAQQAHQIAQDTLIDSVTEIEYSLVVSDGRLYLQEV